MDFVDRTIVALAHDATRHMILNEQTFRSVYEVFAPMSAEQTVFALEEQVAVVLPFDEALTVWVDALFQGVLVILEDGESVDAFDFEVLELEGRIQPVIMPIVVHDPEHPVRETLKDAHRILNELTKQELPKEVEPVVLCVMPLTCFDSEAWPGAETMAGQSKSARREARIKIARAWLANMRVALCVVESLRHVRR